MYGRWVAVLSHGAGHGADADGAVVGQPWIIRLRSVAHATVLFATMKRLYNFLLTKSEDKQVRVGF